MEWLLHLKTVCRIHFWFLCKDIRFNDLFVSNWTDIVCWSTIKCLCPCSSFNGWAISNGHEAVCWMARAAIWMGCRITQLHSVIGSPVCTIGRIKNVLSLTQKTNRELKQTEPQQLERMELQICSPSSLQWFHQGFYRLRACYQIFALFWDWSFSRECTHCTCWKKYRVKLYGWLAFSVKFHHHITIIINTLTKQNEYD